MKIFIPSLIFFLCSVLSFGANSLKTDFKVTLGEERLLEPEYSSLILGKKIGILAHHASRDHQGQHIVDRLVAIPGIQLKMIFAPEHGYRSINDDLTPDSIDTVTGLPVYSLYGPRTAPTADMLASLDAVIIDLQDVGLRYYTYPATMVYTMKACKAAGKKVIILDRPNPLGGDIVDGAMLALSLVTGGLTTLAPIPTRHGMTLGELAIYFNESLNIHADLAVIPMGGWKREMSWNDTLIPWTPSSPALVTADQVNYYAAFGTLEAGGAFAVGRGQSNDLAFQVFGAPWITVSNQDSLVARLNALNLSNLKFDAYSWTPDRTTYQGMLCRGFRVSMNEIQPVSGFGPMLSVLETLYSLFGAQMNLTKMLNMLGADWVIHGIESGDSPAALSERAKNDSAAFLSDREKALIY